MPFTPLVSVVVPCTRPHLIEGIARALAAEPRADQCELVVVGAVAGLDPEGWGVAVTLLACSRRHPNRRRSLGLAVARGGVIAFLDDDAVPEPGWLDQAMLLDPAALEIWTGPERPTRRGRVPRLLHSVSSSPLAEGHRAHVGEDDADVAWFEAPFCNLVTTAAVVAEIGPPPSDIPWDMDDFAWCRAAAAAGVPFRNRAELRVLHDRYPDDVREWLGTKAAERARTGEKMVRYPGTYLRLPGATVAAVVPLVVLALALTAELLDHEVLVVGALSYLAAVASVPMRAGVQARAIPAHVLVTTALHVVSVCSLYVGLAYGAVTVLFRRRDPFLLDESGGPRGVRRIRSWLRARSARRTDARTARPRRLARVPRRTG